MSIHPIQALSLTEFRSYERLDFPITGRSVYLYGPTAPERPTCSKPSAS
ncbi:hypothetical protein ABI_06050 [Asticcacaulis biprosthecium C19]|uniref:Uncharacterized protein n=1 Tax=Asticcacaulis biprosthecium C19 TaxID=715226 RepID=F4QKU9_9CAUL|nr:hypothetical protein ABI_06050 [Asticcacaulis biprosthecium C19]